MPSHINRFKEVVAERSVSLVVGWKDGKDVAGGTVLLSKPSAAIIRDAINQNLEGLRVSKPRTFDYEAELEDGQYFVAQNDLVSDDSAIFKFVRSKESRSIVEAADLPDKSLWFYGFSVGSSAKTATIYFRKSNPYVLMKAGATFSLEGQGLVPFVKPLFKIDGSIDAILFEDEIVILKKNYFEQLFLDEGLVEEKMQETVGEIVAGIGMATKDIELLGDFAVHSLPVRRRLRAIRSRGILQNVTIKDLREEIVRQDLDEADFIKKGKLYVRPGHELELVKLLNEDHYIGGMSKLRYDVDRKSVR